MERSVPRSARVFSGSIQIQFVGSLRRRLTPFHRLRSLKPYFRVQRLSPPVSNLSPTLSTPISTPEMPALSPLEPISNISTRFYDIDTLPDRDSVNFHVQRRLLTFLRLSLTLSKLSMLISKLSTPFVNFSTTFFNIDALPAATPSAHPTTLGNYFKLFANIIKAVGATLRTQRRFRSS